MQQTFRPYHHTYHKPEVHADLSPVGHQKLWTHYLTKRTVSRQKDSSQLGPGTTSAHRGNKWWGRVTLRVKWNSRSAAVTRVSSRITHEDVKSGVNLSGKQTELVLFFPFSRLNFIFWTHIDTKKSIQHDFWFNSMEKDNEISYHCLLKTTQVH